MAAGQRAAGRFSGDANVDFVKGMIPHHQGAIDVARVVLEHGEDEESRKLAEGIIIIRQQGREIAEIACWHLKDRNVADPRSTANGRAR